jgi:hypothetical protein
MSTIVKIKVCGDCLQFSADRNDRELLSADREREISLGFGRWEEYEFTLGECSEKDLMYDSRCGICGKSLTKDRRRRGENHETLDRRSLHYGDRRIPSEDRRRHHDSMVSLERRAASEADRRVRLQDRRRRDENNVAHDRRALPDGDRRSPFSRGARVLLAALPTG